MYLIYVPQLNNASSVFSTFHCTVCNCVMCNVYHQINSLVQCLDVMDMFKVSTTKLQLNITIFLCDAFHLSCTTTQLHCTNSQYCLCTKPHMPRILQITLDKLHHYLCTHLQYITFHTCVLYLISTFPLVPFLL